MDKKDQLKKNAEFILAKFTENFEITKVTPFRAVKDEKLGNYLEFSFEFITYSSDKTPNDKGIPFMVAVYDDYANLDGFNTCITGFSFKDFNDPHFFDNFRNEFML